MPSGWSTAPAIKTSIVQAIGYLLAQDSWASQGLPGAIQGRPDDLKLIDQQITNTLPLELSAVPPPAQAFGSIQADR
jgi:hypothetical protein